MKGGKIMEKETEKEELDMSKKPKNEVAVFGLGVLFSKFDKLANQNESIINLLRHIENKIEANLSEDAEKKLERIKRRF